MMKNRIFIVLLSIIFIVIGATKIYAQPYIKVIQPNSSSNWMIGTPKLIIWESSGVERVKFKFTTDGGFNWIPIPGEALASDLGYTWHIPDNVSPSTMCGILIYEANTASVTGVSSGLFTLSPKSELQLISPNGEENWLAGSSHNIIWESTNVENIKIEYSTDSGVNWNIIIQSTVSDGSYSWLVPNTTSTNCKVRISDLLHEWIYDQSETVFTIRSPS
ncbi:MAG: hypothetical protein WCE54_21095, partial [Ignavibacteriaceae bacterium]